MDENQTVRVAGWLQSIADDRIAKCEHTWVSGMMHVHDEDVHAVAEMRAKAGERLPECEDCGAEYDPSAH